LGRFGFSLSSEADSEALAQIRKPPKFGRLRRTHQKERALYHDDYEVYCKGTLRGLHALQTIAGAYLCKPLPPDLHLGLGATQTTGHLEPSGAGA